ncbi:MAG: SDR family NAD(P)-dependent oxidoreductase, partial [Haliscomenobacter sp.]
PPEPEVSIPTQPEPVAPPEPEVSIPLQSEPVTPAQPEPLIPTQPEVLTPPQPEPKDLLEQAIDLEESGEVELSSSVYENAIERFPYDSALRYHYALLLAKNRSTYGPAIQQLKALIEFNPQHEHAHFLLGELFEVQNQFEDTHHHYLEVSKIDQSFKDIFYLLGMVALKANMEKSLAASYFKMAAHIDPQHKDAPYQYALLAANLPGKTEKAIKYFKKTLALDANHKFALYDLALLYYRENHLGKARKYYLASIENNPEFKTKENDAVFGVVPAPSESPKPTGTEQDMLEALKVTIKKLEELIEQKGPQMDPLPKKTVLITGATSGIGRATAIQFAQHKHRLILTGRRESRLLALCEELQQQYHVETLPLVFDIRDEGAVKNAIHSIPEDWKAIDILINNAGKAKGLSPIHDGKLEHWVEMIDTNIKGLLYITRLIAPTMVERRAGHIINLGSIAGKFIYPNGNVYCATKAAVDALTQGMRQDLYRYNIRVSQVAPGHVEETEFALVRFDGDEEAARIYEDFQPLTSADVADTIYYIASRPAHVNIQDVVLYGTQQASATLVNRSGRDAFKIL